MMQAKILLAGATGYLGRYLVQALLKQDKGFVALGRSLKKLGAMGLGEAQIKLAQVTDPMSLAGCCDGIDIVISCVGITRQKDGLNYMDVDYQANINLLEEAERSGVKKFIYISAFNAPNYQSVRMLYAKEQFAQRLLSSQMLEPCVIRPNGFFSDIEAFYAMAKAGRAYLFGWGDVKVNPIHGEDLARFCLEAAELSSHQGSQPKDSYLNDSPHKAKQTWRPRQDKRELAIGGPDIFSIKELAQLAFKAMDKPEKLMYLPDWVRKLALAVAKQLPERVGGPAEFFLTVSGQDMVAPAYGEHHLLEHFKSLS
ncbi:SDR family oxidoreductase [Marinomonas sp. S3726]|uniref:SDR family oxidoreductase n=1 Tax=Marinomonas sp. S3726 TaxID=579484 RepID=UPI001EE26A82|nr:SDR family oxidoreductase [Marinomonas sp. S3726]